MPKLHPAQASLREVIQGRQVGNWELTEPLGRGGQGTTWRAIWKKDNQSLTQVAVGGGELNRAVIKLMLPPAPQDVPIPRSHFDSWLDRESREFLNEARALGQINNPYIPGVYEAGLQRGQSGWEVPWFATELISGRSLAEQVGTQGPLDQNQLLDLAHDILSALVAIHGAGLVHLDLKPANIMLEPGKARLIDFGLVTRANEKGRLGGTPGFFTPEQLDGVLEEKDFAPAADIFKLGVTLAIAAGVRLADLWDEDPFGENENVRLAMSRGPQLSALPTAIKQIISSMLSFDPSQRPSASSSLDLVRNQLPKGSGKANASNNGSAGQSFDKETDSPQQRQGKHNADAKPPEPVVAHIGNRANIGAKVVVVDRLNLDWTGVVVGIDSKRPGNILVKHESIRGNENIRSYPLKQVVRGTPLK